MDIYYYIGIDVSKATLDWAVFDGKLIVLQIQSPNSETGIKAALKLIKALPGFCPKTSVSCCEHTGIYNALILQQLFGASFPVWLESSLQIKQAGGLQRGKSDQIDAQRIAEYARGGVPLSLPGSVALMATAPLAFTRPHQPKRLTPTVVTGSYTTATAY